ncbi:hypothetical protein [Foetidibacter luteolus]|uniref:hypothetical protein n=1 Tax=Foetidibacter luteolus TaxID=2608880 RepID=UPI00129AFADE|nr:hypothetical protein [Foetidibacter luteolus]
MYKEILSWSEALIILVPLTVYYTRNYTERYLKIVGWYLVVALLLNTLAGFIWQYNQEFRNFLLGYNIPIYFARNNFIYNIHSIVRTAFFIIFFHSIGVQFKRVNTRIPLMLFFFSVLIVFLFYDSFFIISSKLLALEGLVLLVYCVSFFLAKLKEEELSLEFDAGLVITTGLTVYEAINFFIFLFYDVLIVKAKSFAILMWYVHNVTFSVFCLFIAYAFYGKQKSVASKITHA